MNLDRAALKAACYDLARSIRWKDGPVNDVLARAMVESYAREAAHHEEYLVGRGRDPNFIVEGGCPRFCVNGHEAGNCLATRSSNDRREEARCFARAVG